MDKREYNTYEFKNELFTKEYIEKRIAQQKKSVKSRNNDSTDNSTNESTNESKGKSEKDKKFDSYYRLQLQKAGLNPYHSATSDYIKCFDILKKKY